MRILVACEYSGTVRDAFRDRGHDAWSFDFEPDDNESKFHIQSDVIPWLEQGCAQWDMLIAFPPCTDICVSGARHFKTKIADGRQQRALNFVHTLMNTTIEKVCIENPVGVISSTFRKPDQIVQPWQFGHYETKATCLWLKGLPLLKPTQILAKPLIGGWLNTTPSGQNKYGPSKDRWKLRSKTYAGIADAMAEQWGQF